MPEWQIEMIKNENGDINTHTQCVCVCVDVIISIIAVFTVLCSAELCLLRFFAIFCLDNLHISLLHCMH